MILEPIVNSNVDLLLSLVVSEPKSVSKMTYTVSSGMLN